MKYLYIFFLFPFLGIAQTQIGADINGETAGDNSGNTVSISADGSVLAVGAYLNDENGTDSGQVRIYKNISGVWIQQGANINGATAGDYAGSSVSLSADGTIVALGSPRHYGFSGYVKVYKYLSGVWTQQGLDINGASFGDNSGWSVSLSSDGTTVAIGSIGRYSEGHQTGGASVYKNIAGSWIQQGSDINGIINSNSFGRSVSLSTDGSILAVSEPYTTINGGYSGRVRVYKNISGVWIQQGNNLDGLASNGIFGYCVSLSADGSIVAIGATGNSTVATNSGQVQVYKNVSGTWIQQGNNINGNTANSVLGKSVSLSADGNVLVVGSVKSTSITINPGQAQIFKFVSGSWMQYGIDIIGTNGDSFGSSVSLSADGNTVAVGGPNTNTNGTNSGVARVYDISMILASNNFVMENFSVYPNPTSHHLVIQFQENLEFQKTNIYNNLGQLVKEETKKEINVNDLAQGTYFIEVFTNQGKATKTFIKE